MDEKYHITLTGNWRWLIGWQYYLDPVRGVPNGNVNFQYVFTTVKSFHNLSAVRNGRRMSTKHRKLWSEILVKILHKRWKSFNKISPCSFYRCARAAGHCMVLRKNNKNHQSSQECQLTYDKIRFTMHLAYCPYKNELSESFF